jgi:23S rRNA pseudouridine1911/1915/1917 synthase
VSHQTGDLPGELPDLIVVDPSHDGDRLDVAVSAALGLPRAQGTALIDAGLVAVGGEVAKKSDRVSTGDRITVTPPPVPDESSGVWSGGDIPVVYRDDHIVVVDKPPHVAVHPAPGWDGPTITQSLAAQGIQLSTMGPSERRGVVHRLDGGTSGVMVLAASDISYLALKQAFHDRQVDKRYLALVQGYPDPSSGTIDAPIGRHPSSSWKFAVTTGGKHAVTHYDTREVFAGATLVDIVLETGRTHQIRVHFQAERHPLVGDGLYGADPTFTKRLGLDRQWLHAVSVAFVHPATGERVEFHSDPSPDLVRALELLELSP